MNTHYLTTSRNNPQFYIFTQCLDESSNTSDFVSNWKHTEQTAWESFWEHQGHELLEAKWNKCHPEYKELIATASPEETTAWQELWQQHASELSAQFWYIFSCAFENYQRDLVKSFEGNGQDITIISEQLAQFDLEEPADVKRKRSKKTSDEEYLTANDDPDEVDEAQLELFGLPIAFGVQKRKTRKSKAAQHINYEDSESDSETEMPKNSKAAWPGIQTHAINKPAKAKKVRFNKNMPEFMVEDNKLLKYWFKRFSLFSRFDQGIRLDRESWFSVTPEKIAGQTARRLACDVIVDAFCGCGGNAIQFAKTCGRVIAVDIDKSKLDMAKHNAAIYGVAHKIEFVQADFLQFARSTQLRPDAVFLSPPWGGPNYLNRPTYDIEQCLQPVGATQLMQLARGLSENVGCFLPRNADMQQLIKLAGVGQQCEVEHNYLDTRLVAITGYFGKSLIKRQRKQ